MKNYWAAMVICFLCMLIFAAPGWAGSAVWLPEMQGTPHSAGEGLTYIVKHGRLIAADSQTGRVLWRFGRNIADKANPCDSAGFVWYADHHVYTCSKTSRVYALQARTGRLLWRSDQMPVEEIGGLETSAGDLVIFGASQIVWFQAAKGNVVKRISLKNRPDLLPLMDQDVILVRHYESGAYIAEVTDAYDRHSGKFLWAHLGMADTITAHTAELLYHYHMQDPEPHAQVTRYTLDKQTGNVLKHVLLVP